MYEPMPHHQSAADGTDNETDICTAATKTSHPFLTFWRHAWCNTIHHKTYLFFVAAKILQAWC